MRSRISAWFLAFLVLHMAREGVPCAAADEPAKSPNVITVAKSAGADFKTIQAAIDAVPAGGVIEIGEGRFAERLTVDKPLTLVGAGSDKTVIGPTEALFLHPFQEAPERFAAIRQAIETAASDAERQALIRDFFLDYYAATIALSDAGEVRLSGLRMTLPGTPPNTNGMIGGVAVVSVRGSHAHIDKCAVVGSIAEGILVADDAQVEIRDSLVAACWNTGVAVGTHGGKGARMKIVGSDVRNCFYAGILIRQDAGPCSIEGCRISGSAWHGVRYDDCSPTISGSAIFRNAGFGIYASGNTKATLRGNLLYKNGAHGMGCLGGNHDSIEQNSFVANAQEGLFVHATAGPDIRRNVFMGSPVGILFGVSELAGSLKVEQNLFWEITNSAAVNRPAPKPDEPLYEPIALDQRAGDVIDPGITILPSGDFSLAEDSPAKREGKGALQPLSLQSVWPLSLEEKAMIPDGETRESSKWKAKEPVKKPPKLANPAVPAA